MGCAGRPNLRAPAPKFRPLLAPTTLKRRIGHILQTWTDAQVSEDIINVIVIHS